MRVEETVVKIAGVFVDALPHVPEHRRLPVLVQLVDTLGAGRFLWVLLVLLFDQYVTKTALAAAYGEKVRPEGGRGGACRFTQSGAISRCERGAGDAQHTLSNSARSLRIAVRDVSGFL